MNMETKEEILQRAAARGKSAGLPYAGEVTPQEAFTLHSQYGAKIIDVRSKLEHDYIGRIPDAPLNEWKFWPCGESNPKFMETLQAQARPDEVVLFLCRSGARSHSAAIVATEAGYIHAYNILEGFEGDLDANKQRGKVGGWRKAGLPWVQN
jgi:rhodanese-related sulfurtransferase